MKKICLIVDEREVANQKYNIVLVDNLKSPTNTYLNECLPCERCSSVNSGFVLHTVNDILQQLGTKLENFALLLTDIARFMFLPGKTPKDYTRL